MSEATVLDPTHHVGHPNFGTDDFRRLETKVDKLADAIQRLILIEERQSSQGERIGKVEAQGAVHDAYLHRIDRKLDMWINRGIGVWGLAITLFAVMQFSIRFFGK